MLNNRFGSFIISLRIGDIRQAKQKQNDRFCNKMAFFHGWKVDKEEGFV